MGATIRCAGFRMPPFWIWHGLDLSFASGPLAGDAILSLQLLAYFFQVCPARVSHGAHAITAFKVEVASAMRA
jgi:hypothetical protein